MSSLCVKCKTNPPSIDIKFALYCSPCFLEATYHKYRTLLARSRDDSVDRNTPSNGLIILPRTFSSSRQVCLASRLLIHFSQLPGIQEPARKNLIHYQLAIPIEQHSQNDSIDDFVKTVKSEYPNLGQVHFLSLSGDEKSATNEDSLNSKLLHLQLNLMDQLKIDRALCPDTSTALAAHILSCTCKGRGQFLPFDSALIRAYPDGKFISRPLKEISDREVELYCQEAKILSSLPLKLTNTPSNIDELTLKFITELESENPGTSNVVIRTSSKVTTSTSDLDGSHRCEVCLVPLCENDPSICRSCCQYHY